MSEEAKTEIDTGMLCLMMRLKILQKPFSLENLRHRVGKESKINSADILFLAEEHLNLKAKRKVASVFRFKTLPLPIIAELKDQRFCLIIKVDDNEVFYQDPLTDKNENQPLRDFDRIYNGAVILISDRPTERKFDEFENFGMGWFAKAFLKFRFLSAQIIISSIVMQMFILITPLFTMAIIDKVLSSSSKVTLDVLIMGLVIIALFDFIITQSRTYLLHHSSNKVDLYLVSKLFQHLISLPMVFFTGKQTGDTISRMKEVESIRNFITGTALTALIDFPFSLLFLVVMYFFSPLLCMVVIVAVVLSLLIFGVAGPIMKKRMKQKQQDSTDNSSFLFETVVSIETIKSLSAESRMQKAWEDKLVSNAENSSKSEILSNKLNSASGFINKFTIAACLWLGALGVIEGSMTAGQLIAFNMLVGRVMGPAQRIAQIFQQFNQIKVSAGRIKEIFQTKPEPALHSNLVSLPRLTGNLRVDHVSFKYKVDSEPVFDKISFEVPAGQVIGVVGRSGSGKSSLMKLLQRLYMPTEGRIFIDGINIAEINPNWFRKNIGIVLQDSNLLDRSIRENISLANPSLTMEQIEKAAALSGADEFIRKLPQVYDSPVGERGCFLSAGERQRIALARALVNDPKILILDEATSSLDYESEQIIQDNMVNICTGRTVFIVAHRFSTLRIAERIITIEEGKIVEDGSIQELLRGTGPFSRLFRLQNMVYKNMPKQDQDKKQSPKQDQDKKQPDKDNVA